MADKVFYSKVINPFKAPIYKGSRKYQVYFKLEIGQLGNNKFPYFSVTGVHAPLKSGNCLGSCGQNIDDFKNIKNELVFNVGWDMNLYYKLITLWEKYHLHNVEIENDIYNDIVGICNTFPETDKQPAWI